MPDCEYLVAFGRAGHLGRFRTAAHYCRNESVVIRGRRGLELGEILGESDASGATLPDDYVGEILRTSAEDDRRASEQAARRAAKICHEAEAYAADLNMPLAVLDFEVTLDGRGGVLHGLAHGACDAGPLLERLGESHGMIVRLYDLAREQAAPSPAPDHEEKLTCGKPDCGEGKCDSDGGGCSSCSAGAAKDLAAYFAGLRERMERRPAVPLA